MSKPKGKDKKQENVEQLEKEFENQKRELLDAGFTIKKLQERLNFLTQDNYRLENERHAQYVVLNEKIEELTIKNETNEKRLITMRNDLTNSEVENKKLINSLNLLDKNTGEERAERAKEAEEAKKNHNFEITKFENMLSDYKLYMSEREGRQREIHELQEAKEIEIANRIREVADKEREKVQATDKIRDEMGNKIREMRQNLLSLKKEELETTTRLTMLQNHQLTSELEYQSKQTEKIVFKNEHLEQTILKLQQELDIHKQIEDELAKRSHFSKAIIKKLHAKVDQLENEADKSKLSAPLHLCPSDDEDSLPPRDQGQKQEKLMAQAMDKEVERWEKKHAELQSRHDSLRREKEELSLKWETSQRTKNELFNALLHGYRGISSEESAGGKENQSLSVSLSRLKQRSPSEWSGEEVRAVVQILLATCQPYLTGPNLSVPQLRKVVVFGEEKNLLPRLATEREKRLFVSASEKKINLEEDVCTLVKNELSQEKYSINIASKMVTNRLREWGRQVPSKNRATLSKKYQLSCTYRT